MINYQGKFFNPFEFTKSFFDYLQDASQRSILLVDVLRERGDNYLEHRKKGKPPVLDFECQVIKDGRSCEHPVNFDLVKVIRSKNNNQGSNLTSSVNLMHHWNRRPIVIVDPRAGHGPGIGGMKRESEVGEAIKMGHPVYFIIFHPEPIPGQTLSDVEKAQIEFLKEVIKRHPDLKKPAVIGNCQAGWATAMLIADRPDLASIGIFNGAPLSYWAGVSGQNPMRYKGGLLGGSWLASLISDLGNGIFDGAHLVDGFENLNLAHTLFRKPYNVYTKIDSETRRYLTFEKWWSGFYFMTKEEISQIVQCLFVGNELEQGKFILHKGEEPIDLKRIKKAVVFASKGDNITPPQQALNWILAVYRDVDHIVELGNTIIYCVHKTIGHLGIFTAQKVAEKEHRVIIGALRKIDNLPAGLYELVITDDLEFTFEKRVFSDIREYGDARDDQAAFEKMKAKSERNQKYYDLYVSPFVKASTNSFIGESIKRSHPLRVARYAFSRLNPASPAIERMAEQVRENRNMVDEKNDFRKLEFYFSSIFEEFLKLFGNVRDAGQELAFGLLHG
ncbi:MAG: DUF3141 domain-containing protein [Candidatus Magasanikbacteria bacterium]|nr:DUF3141 domain-containing protein [Candidatus Magasanikbacteria bacterium]